MRGYPMVMDIIESIRQYYTERLVPPLIFLATSEPTPADFHPRSGYAQDPIEVTPFPSETVVKALQSQNA